MNILVTGANGQLGTHMRLKSTGSRHQYFFTDIEELDITDRHAIQLYVKEHAIQAIVNCAAYTNVDKAESDEITADRINHIAVGYMADTMASVGGLLVHISTDYVFGGALYNVPLVENAATNPTGAYGRTKLAGEKAVLDSGCRYIIFRTAWLYSEYGKNFCKTMLNLTATKPNLSVVFDQVGTPTYAGDLASAIYSILENDLDKANEGIYHFSNEGVCSWFDFTKEIARQSGHNDCDIQPCHSSEYPTPVVRPSYSVLDKTKFKQTFHLPVPYWVDSLSVCLKGLL
jgi:dTDP-4-dehydrorhamnose reductase